MAHGDRIAVEHDIRVRRLSRRVAAQLGKERQTNHGTLRLALGRRDYGEGDGTEYHPGRRAAVRVRRVEELRRVEPACDEEGT